MHRIQSYSVWRGWSYTNPSTADSLLSPGDCLLSKLPNPRIPSDHKAEKNKNQKKKNNSCRTSFCSPSPAYQRAASKHSTKAVTANLSICLYSERCSAMCLCPDTAQHLRSECRDNSLSGKSSFLSAEKAKLVHCKFRWRFSGNTAWSGSSRLAGAACGCPSTNAGGKGTLFWPAYHTAVTSDYEAPSSCRHKSCRKSRLSLTGNLLHKSGKDRCGIHLFWRLHDYAAVSSGQSPHIPVLSDIRLYMEGYLYLSLSCHRRHVTANACTENSYNHV